MKLYQLIFKAIIGDGEYIEVKETKDRFTATKQITCPVQSDREEIVRLATLLPERDLVSLSLVMATPIFQTEDLSHDVDKIIEILGDALYKDEELEVKLQIDKTLDAGQKSVYDYQAFSEYLGDLNLCDFLNEYSHLLHQGFLTFEIFDEEQKSWTTTTCLVRDYRSTAQPTPIHGEYRQKINKLRERLCHCENAYGSLVPQDLIITSGVEDDQLQDVFQRVALMFILIHLYDYSSLSATEYRFKLCGYKTLAGIIATNKVSELPFKINDYNDFYLIYKWCYEYGQRDEKMAIARNVISLNMVFENGTPPKFEIEKGIYETVRSNYDFFERDHIRQYVELHSKLNETILGLEDKMIVCVNKFIQEFKTGLFVIATFMSSSAILKISDKAQSFTSIVKGFSLVLIVIYILSFCYTCWETNKAIDRYSDKFDVLKRRYQGILSPKEKLELFGDEKIYPHGKEIKFAEQRLKYYSIAWLVMAAVFVVVVLLIF